MREGDSSVSLFEYVINHLEVKNGQNVFLYNCGIGESGACFFADAAWPGRASAVQRNASMIDGMHFTEDLCSTDQRNLRDIY